MQIAFRLLALRRYRLHVIDKYLIGSPFSRLRLILLLSPLVRGAYLL